MDNSIIIIDSKISLSEFKRWSDNTVQMEWEGNYVLHHGDKNDFITLIKDKNLINEYDGKELTEVKAHILYPTFYTIDTNCFQLLKKLVGIIPTHESVLIDNNHGKIMSREELLKCESFSDFFTASVGPNYPSGE